MKNLFNLDTPFMQMLTRIGDMIIINVLCLICSIPIVTAGAALSATHRLMQDFVMDNEGAIVKTFFRVFKENFKQATIVWLAMVVITAGLACDFFLVYFYFEGTLATVLYVLLALLTLIAFGTAAFLLPLLTRYQNTLAQHTQNALILMITKFPRTLVMVVLHALPLIVFLLSLTVFVQTLIFWLIIGVSFIIYLDTILLKPVFLELEKSK